MRKATQSSGNHHGLGHTPKSFVYLASADVQSEHHLPLLPRQTWESFSMEKLNQLFMLCNWLSTRGHCKMRGPTFAMIFSNPLFHQSILTFPTSPPAIPVLRRGIFFEKIPPASSESSPKQDSVSSSMKISRSSWQSVRNIETEVFENPLWPLMSRWANMLAKFGWKFLEVFWGFTYGNFSHWICAAFSKHPSIRIYSVYSKVGHAISKETTHLDHRCCASAMYTLP